MDDVSSQESDLVIVSLVRYADACEPVRRHSDCPFAVEQHGQLTCHEECRGVIASLLRRGRALPASGYQLFDARQLRLSELPGAPDVSWHTSSLLQVVVAAARSSPLRQDGGLNLRRYVDATSALGALGARGVDPDYLVRRGLAKTVKLGLVVWLRRLLVRSDNQWRDWEYADSWRVIFDQGISEQASTSDYIEAAMTGPIADRLDAWIESAPIEDVLLWVPPQASSELKSTDSAYEDTELWAWLVERFTQTYLERWSLASLKLEYAFVQGFLMPKFSTELLADRIVAREEVATALADRAMITDEVVDPSTMSSFTEQAVALREDGQRNAAAALFDAARRLKPADVAVQNNYAFCILIDRPQEARGLLTDALARKVQNPAVTWCNLALVERLLGDRDAALTACEQAYETARDDGNAFLWRQRDGDWVVEDTNPRSWAVSTGAELERLSDPPGNVWAERLERLSFLEPLETSSDPSSREKDEEDQ